MYKAILIILFLPTIAFAGPWDGEPWGASDGPWGTSEVSTTTSSSSTTTSICAENPATADQDMNSHTLTNVANLQSTDNMAITSTFLQHNNYTVSSDVTVTYAYLRGNTIKVDVANVSISATKLLSGAIASFDLVAIGAITVGFNPNDSDNVILDGVALGNGDCVAIGSWDSATTRPQLTCEQDDSNTWDCCCVSGDCIDSGATNP